MKTLFPDSNPLSPVSQLGGSLTLVVLGLRLSPLGILVELVKVPEERKAYKLKTITQTADVHHYPHLAYSKYPLSHDSSTRIADSNSRFRSR